MTVTILSDVLSDMAMRLKPSEKAVLSKILVKARAAKKAKAAAKKKSK